jgi:hypothetical protein
VNDEHWNATPPVESLADRLEKPTPPVGLTHDDEVPATGSSLFEERGSGSSARHELGYRDVLGHQPRRLLEVSLRPGHEVLLEPVPADGQHQRSRGRDRRSRGGAAKESQPSVARLDQLDGPCQRFPGGLAVVDSDEDSVEHGGS